MHTHPVERMALTAAVVQGYTDSTGTEEHNHALSQRRADSVTAFLVDRGLDADRITTIGYGEGHPVAGNETPEGR